MERASYPSVGLVIESGYWAAILNHFVNAHSKGFTQFSPQLRGENMSQQKLVVPLDAFGRNARLKDRDLMPKETRREPDVRPPRTDLRKPAFRKKKDPTRRKDKDRKDELEILEDTDVTLSSRVVSIAVRVKGEPNAAQ